MPSTPKVVTWPSPIAGDERVPGKLPAGPDAPLAAYWSLHISSPVSEIQAAHDSGAVFPCHHISFLSPFTAGDDTPLPIYTLHFLSSVWAIGWELQNRSLRRRDSCLAIAANLGPKWRTAFHSSTHRHCQQGLLKRVHGVPFESKTCRLKISRSYPIEMDNQSNCWSSDGSRHFCLKHKNILEHTSSVEAKQASRKTGLGTGKISTHVGTWLPQFPLA